MKCSMSILVPLLTLSFFTICGHSDKPPGDTARAGNYYLYGCASRVPAVQSLLDQIYTSLQEIIENLDAAETTPTPIYHAFFRGVDPKRITTIFDRITTGANITLTVSKVQLPPMIVCADSRFQNTDFFANECAKDAAILAGAVVGTQFIFLCPAFFTTPVFPLESQCPVVKSVTTLSAGVDAWSTQYTSMLHELVRIYLGTYLEPPVDKINEVMVLGPGDSVINMGSYAWYAIFMKAGCNQLPRVPRRPAGRRLTQVGASNASSMFKDVVLPPGCASDSLPALFGGCTPATA